MEFEKRFVHFMSDNELKGKKVIYADNIIDLKERVIACDSVNYEYQLGIVTAVLEAEYPFEIDGCFYKFVYNDPYLELKIAHEQGKVIELYAESLDEWFPLKEEPNWHCSPSHYRIAEDKQVTNKEFARWVGSNLGQWRHEDEDTAYNGSFSYAWIVAYGSIPPDILVKKWDDTEWVKPTRAYLGLDN